ncbi:MAG: hypothetical protein VYD64_04185 [Pseudomonadota bacterium]|nr:hypothetical protein [Pseudomonadota bacterium]MEC9367941.1 hypothetical protein [Pseudomonadota bacterium]
MRNLPFAFLAFGVLCVLVGMAYGIHMAAQQDYTTAPAHAHLNLLGFVLSAIFAFYYHLVPSAQGPTGWAHFVIHAVAVVLMFPGVIMADLGQGDGLAIFSSLLAILAMLVFAWILIRNRVPQAAEA